MPSRWLGYRRRKPTCRKAFKWSTMRGGCRFEPGHQGDCKPKKSGVRASWGLA